MDKKILVLDTNIIYLLSGITNNKYNVKSIKQFCLDNECWINLYSIFEIYNNSNLTLDQIRKIVIMIRKQNIRVCCNASMRSTFNDTLNMGLITPVNRMQIRKTLSKEIIPEYSRLFTFLSTINFFILFLFNDKADNEYYKELCSFVVKLLPVINKHVQLVMERIFQKNNFTEKSLKNLYACLLSSFQFTILNHDEKYKKNKGLDTSAEYFNILFEEFERDDFMDCCIKFVMESSYQKGLTILPNMYKLVFKPRYPTKEDADCFIDDIVGLIYRKDEDNLEKEWFKYMLKNLFCDESNLKTNNFIDFLIIKDFTLDSRTDNLLTCDEGMQKIMQVLGFNKKINKSVELMQTFKV